MGDEEGGVSIAQVVQQITTSLCNAVPELVLRLKALGAQNAQPQPDVLNSVEGVAKAADGLAKTCEEIANEDYEDYPEIKKDILTSASLVTKSSVKLRRANIKLNQKVPGDRAPLYDDVADAATAISAACIHVLEVVYGSYLRICTFTCEEACDAMRENATCTQDASSDAQHYADTVGDVCSKANLFAEKLYSLSENERDPDAGAKFNSMGSKVENASQRFLDAGNDYLGALDDTSKRDAAQRAQDNLLAVMIEAGALVSARKSAVGMKTEPVPEPAPVPVQPVEEQLPPERPSLASQIPPIQTPLMYLTLVAEQKRQCDLVDDLVATAKLQMRQAMVEDGRAIVQRHRIITLEAERLCESDMARDAVNDTAEKADAAIRTLIKNGSNVLDNPDNEEMKSALVTSATEYKIITMKFSDDCLLKPQEGRTLTKCQQLRIAITEMRAGDEVLSLLEEALGEYNYRVERVQNDDLKEELQEDVRLIEIDVRAFAAKNGEEERDTALDSMDRFENAMIAYLLSLIETALSDTKKLFSAISSKDDAALDAGTRTVVSNVTEVITESHNISEEYTGCVEGTQDDFEGGSKRLEKALPELIKAARSVKAGRTQPNETVNEQQEVEAALHYLEELCRRAQYKRVPKKHEVEPEPPKVVEEKKPEPEPEPEPKPEPPKEPESVVVERKKPAEEEQKTEKTETTAEVAKKEESKDGGLNMNVIIVAIIVLIIVIILKAF